MPSVREVELVWRDLKALGSAGSAATGGHTRDAGRPDRLGIMFGALTRRDEYGSYGSNSAPLVAHWALRVEFNVGRGVNEGVQWRYFGLTRDANGDCQLQETQVDCPVGRDRLWDAKTTWTLAQIQAHAREIMGGLDKYDVFSNNCQHFAKRLFFDIAYDIKKEAELRQFLQSRDLA